MALSATGSDETIFIGAPGPLAALEEGGKPSGRLTLPSPSGPSRDLTPTSESLKQHRGTSYSSDFKHLKLVAAQESVSNL